MKILILKPTSLGDVIQALPVLRLLKLHFPESEIHWWIASELASILEGDPDLSGLFLFDRKSLKSIKRWPDVLNTIRAIRRERFDWVLDLQGLARSAAVAWLSRGKVVIGVDDPREGAPAAYDIRVPRPSQKTHAVDWYLQVLRKLEVPVHDRFIWMPPRPTAAENVLKRWPMASGRWMAVIPGARWDNKRWPAEHFATLVARLAGGHPELRFVILGGAADQSAGERIRQAASDRVLDLTGRTSLVEMIECIRLSEFVVSNDTGPMHVAAAMRKPLVALLGPTDPFRTGPYGQLDRVIQTSLPCIPCLKPTCAFIKPMECLKAIDPGKVFRAIDSRLRSGKPFA